MTRKEAVEKLNGLHESEDKEYAHKDANETLIEFLYSIGEDEIVKAYQKVPKWYA